MRRLRTALLVQLMGVGISALCAGCSTPGYLGNRARDAGDIFTATVGVGAGVKARVGPLVAGLSYYQDSLGVRGGDVGIYKGRKIFRSGDLKGDCTVVFCGGDHFETDVTGPRLKSIDSRTPTFEVIPFILAIPAPFIEAQRKQPTAGASYYTQVEGVIALGGGIRLGFNPGELLDFFLGWFHVDMFGDDSAKSERTIGSSLPFTRGTPPAYARAAPGFREAQP